MSNNYVTEAFKELDVLTEDTFAVSDAGVDKLKSFMDMDDADDSQIIIDPEANTADDLKDSYVGKVILNCPVCESKIYKDVEEIVVEEGEDLCNIEEECPYCQTSGGFEIVGQVAAYSDSKANSEPKTEEEVPVTEPAIEEALNKGSIEDYFKDVDKGYGYVTLEKAVEDLGKSGEEITAWVKENSNIAYMLKFGAIDVIFTPNAPDYAEVAKELGISEDDIKDLNESVNKVNVETDDSIVNVDTDDTGKVTVTTEPKADAEGEMIVPVSDEVKAEIETSAEEPVEDTEVDIDIDTFDEAEFDELGEGYLKRVYENVASYKTTTASIEDNTMKFEGVITFKSGKTADTTFLFEAHTATKTGKVKLVGQNPNLSKNKKAFTLTGKVEDKKFISENWTYNYKAKDAKTGKVEKLYGKVTRK